jgi:hypothetical protein
MRLPPSPADIAAADQDHATINQLVADVRRHHTDGSCPWPNMCLGHVVAHTIYDTSPDRLQGLLAAALVQLVQPNRTTDQKG